MRTHTRGSGPAPARLPRRIAWAVVLCTMLALVPAGAASAAGPAVSSFSPTSSVVNTKVTINGKNFTNVKTVAFAGVKAKWKLVSASKITATVPLAAKSGKISVTTSAGTATSAGSFAVLPSISSFSPSSGTIGSTVSIAGSGFFGATGVTLNGGTQYWFYTDTQGSFVTSFSESIYAGGDLYVTGVPTFPFHKAMGGPGIFLDANFTLSGAASTP